MAGTHGRMRVCIDHIRNCPFEKSGIHVRADSRKWINYQVGIQKGPHMCRDTLHNMWPMSSVKRRIEDDLLRLQIYFVADRLKKNYVIGLDQVQLLNKSGTSAMRCRI
uniref:Uncharacterized protein n=1 Tax=Parascaris equorum TaxID=6256 RepID=A0A914RD73_PAREQ